DIKSLPFCEMIEAFNYNTRFSHVIAIAFKSESGHGRFLSSFRRRIQGIAKEKSKIVLLNVDFADIDKFDLIQIINERIDRANSKGQLVA
ncbi:MAG: hypothetical protein ACKOE6_07795, partial [Flammeovirgaceae bacterium]